MNKPDTLFVREELQRVVGQYGGWTDHNIKVAPDIYTIDRRPVSPKLRRIVQIVSDLSGKELSGLRVLDLGCLEGGYAIEFAMHGAEVVAVEGREANIAKARVVKTLLHLDNLTLHHDDVRNLSLETWGSFDVVLCLGVFYHIDAPALFCFAERIATVCTRLAVFDTEVSVRACRSYKHRDRVYSGRDVIEHDPRSSPEERLQELWGSLDNQTSTWLTKPSLLNLLHICGFSSVYECNVPIEPRKRDDRLTIVAIKSQLVTIKSVDEGVTPAFWLLESGKKRFNVEQRWVYAIRRQVTLKVPRAVRAAAKVFLRRIGLMSKSPRFWELPWQVRHTAGQPGHASELESDRCRR
jgi:SAM-dependent methyltransferase